MWLVSDRSQVNHQHTCDIRTGGLTAPVWQTRAAFQSLAARHRPKSLAAATRIPTRMIVRGRTGEIDGNQF